MNIGKFIRRNGTFFIRCLTTKELHHVECSEGAFSLGEYYSFEINENDDAVELTHAADALQAYGIQASTGSFFTVRNEETNEPEEAESFFGTCELTGMKGDVVPCLYLDTDGNVVSVEVGTWLVFTVLGKLAGAF